jgi:hypothetical protein
MVQDFDLLAHCCVEIGAVRIVYSSGICGHLGGASGMEGFELSPSIVAASPHVDHTDLCPVYPVFFRVIFDMVDLKGLVIAPHSRKCIFMYL